MPELFAPEDRKNVNFHSFSKDKERALNLKKSLQCFVPEQENQFFYAVLYGLMYHKIKDATPISKISIDDAEKTVGRDFYFELQKIKPAVMLDYTVFGFFDRCKTMNWVLSRFGFFLKFYERRNKFRYQLRQKLKSKNEMRTELSACVIQKFNGYDLLRNNLQSNENTELVPIDIVYETTLDVSKPILCFFAPEIYIAYQTFYEKSLGENKQKGVNSTAAKQCPYCNNFFLKSKEKMKKHISTCSG